MECPLLQTPQATSGVSVATTPRPSLQQCSQLRAPCSVLGPEVSRHRSTFHDQSIVDNASSADSRWNDHHYPDWFSNRDCQAAHVRAALSSRVLRHHAPYLGRGRGYLSHPCYGSHVELCKHLRAAGFRHL